MLIGTFSAIAATQYLKSVENNRREVAQVIVTRIAFAAFDLVLRLFLSRQAVSGNSQLVYSGEEHGLG